MCDNPDIRPAKRPPAGRKPGGLREVGSRAVADERTVRPADPDTPRVTVFSPHPFLSITIERRGVDEDDIHIHAGGQGVWVGRMVGEMGAYPIVCGFSGGETGAVLAPLLDALPGEVRPVRTAASSGSYVIDRRSGDREMIAHAWSDPPSRHEIDDLFSVTCAAALESEVLVVCGPVPSDALPLDLYKRLVRDVRMHGTIVLVDLSPPRLDSALEGGPSLVKLDEWQLAEFVSGPVTAPDARRAAAEKVLERGAEAVVVTSGGEPALVLRNGKAFELVPPAFDEGAAEGSGDSMVGATAAALAKGVDFEEALRLGAAAGATNFLRHGLGTGSRDIVRDLVKLVELRPI
jgi:1-phosphofructokinase